MGETPAGLVATPKPNTKGDETVRKKQERKLAEEALCWAEEQNEETLRAFGEEDEETSQAERVRKGLAALRKLLD